jgi:hypothetical protein
MLIKSLINTSALGISDVCSEEYQIITYMEIVRSLA